MNDSYQVQNGIFWDAVLAGNINIVSSLLTPLTARQSLEKLVNPLTGKNPLHVAAELGHLNLVELFVDRFPHIIDCKSNDGTTAILYATETQRTQVVMFLNKRSAKLSLKNNSGENCFTIARQITDSHPLYFINEIRKEYYDSINANFLDCIINGNVDGAEQWLEQDADIEVPFSGEDGRTALYDACMTGDANLVAMLLKHKPNLNAVNKQNGFTPLHAAVAANSSDVVKLLLRAGAAQLKDDKQKTALDLAKDKGFKAIIDVFEKRFVLTKSSNSANTSAKHSPAPSPLPSPRSSASSSTSSSSTAQISSRLNSAHNSPRTSSSSIRRPSSRDATPTSSPRGSLILSSSPDKGSSLSRRSSSHRHRSRTGLTNSNPTPIEIPSVENIQAKIDLLLKCIKSISTYGLNCIAFTNDTYKSTKLTGMCITTDAFTKDIQMVQEFINKLDTFFNTTDPDDMKDKITANFDLTSTISIALTTVKKLHEFMTSKILPDGDRSENYIKLFAELNSFVHEAEKLLKILVSIHDGKVDLVHNEGKYLGSILVKASF